MLCVINLRQHTSLCGSTKMKPPFLPFNEPMLCNDYIFMDSDYSDCFCFLNQIYLDTKQLDNVRFKKVVVQPTRKPRSVGQHKSKSKKTTNKKKLGLKNKKFWSVSTQLRRGSTEPSNDRKNILQQRLFYTNKDLKKYLFINDGTSIPIVT